MFPKSFSNFTFYQKKKDILIYKAADSNHQYILKCSENTTPALKQALLDEYEGLFLCPIHLSQSIMGSARISHYQNQILLSLRFVWSAVMAAYCLNSYHFWL